MKPRPGRTSLSSSTTARTGNTTARGPAHGFRPQTTNDVIRALPDMKHGESGVLQIVDMTGEKLLRTLEYAIPADNDIRGWFYYFSGLKMTYAPPPYPESASSK